METLVKYVKAFLQWKLFQTFHILFATDFSQNVLFAMDLFGKYATFFFNTFLHRIFLANMSTPFCKGAFCKCPGVCTMPPCHRPQPSRCRTGILSLRISSVPWDTSMSQHCGHGHHKTKWWPWFLLQGAFPKHAGCPPTPCCHCQPWYHASQWLPFCKGILSFPPPPPPFCKGVLSSFPPPPQSQCQVALEGLVRCSCGLFCRSSLAPLPSLCWAWEAACRACLFSMLLLLLSSPAPATAPAIFLPEFQPLFPPQSHPHSSLFPSSSTHSQPLARSLNAGLLELMPAANLLCLLALLVVPWPGALYALLTYSQGIFLFAKVARRQGAILQRSCWQGAFLQRSFGFPFAKVFNALPFGKGQGQSPFAKVKLYGWSYGCPPRVEKS